MNYYPNLTTDYIGASGSHNITDYIDLTSNNLNTNINITSNTLYDLIDYNITNGVNVIDNYYKLMIEKKYTNEEYFGTIYNVPHTYISNSNQSPFSEIRFYSSNVKNYPNYDPLNIPNHRVKIGNDGKLYIYYSFDPAISATLLSGWIDLNQEIGKQQADGFNQGASIAGLEGQILVLNAVDVELTKQIVELFGLVGGGAGGSLAGSAVNIPNVQNGLITSTQIESIRNSLNINLTATQSALTNMGGATAGLSIIYGVYQTLRNNDYINSILDGLRSNIDSNITNGYLANVPILSNANYYTSNNFLRENLNNVNIYTCNLALYNGFINCNIITTQYIPSLNTNEIKFYNTSLMSYVPNAPLPVNTNGIFTNLNNNFAYLSFTQNGTIQFTENTLCDLLVVGAGGRGGIGNTNGSGGGGGAGEVIYYPNFNIPAGSYQIQVGVDSSTPSNRISKIYSGTDLIYALGGGNGGSSLLLTDTGTVNLINNGTYSINYQTSVNINAGTYSIIFNNGLISFGAVNDNSYPVLKDGSGNNINPTAWYRFDVSTNVGLDTLTTHSLVNNNSTTTTSSSLKGTLASLFNGTNQYLSSTSAVNLNSKSFSISCWVYPTELDASNRWIYAFNGTQGSGGSANRGKWLYIGFRLNRIEMSFYFDDLFISITNANYINKWTYLTFIYDHTSRTQKIYVNGVSQATRTTTGTSGIIAPTQDYAIGRGGIGISGNTGYFQGRIDDFRIYNNRVLTDTEILELYKGRINFIILPSSGGSGGGGASFGNQTGANAGTPFNATFSKLNNGFSGNGTSSGAGGSASTFLGNPSRYIEPITGTNIEVGKGGDGEPIGGVPSTKTNYGDGGDGNSGNGFQGIIIVKFPYSSQKINFNGLLDYTKIENIPPQSNSKWFLNTTTNNIYNTNLGNVGIGTNNPNYKLDVIGDIEFTNNLYYNGSLTLPNSITGTATNLSGNPSISVSGINLNSTGNITGANQITATNFYGYFNGNVSGTSTGLSGNPSVSLSGINLNFGSITNAGSIVATALTGTPAISVSSINVNNGNINNVNQIYATNFRGVADSAIISYRLNPYTNEWLKSNGDNINRFYFGNGSHTYFGTADAYYFRNGVDSDIITISNVGYFTCGLEVVTSSRDYVGIDEPNTQGTIARKPLKVYWGSFTEFHRCFIEDELFLIENREQFLEEYEGRVVISIGKIKQERRDGEGGEFPEWTILENKEAVRIDDAQPIIQLSRIRKDKKIYGVIGSKKIGNYSKDRIGINGVGEGAIWVVNTNGNIENGDLLQTSTELGYAEKADDDIIRNSTIAKAVIDCSFDLNSPYYKSKDLGGGIIASFIACVYMCS